MKILVLILVVINFKGVLLGGDTLTLDVVKEHLSFPYSKVANEVVVASPSFYPTTKQILQPEQFISRFHYNLNVSQLLPRDRYFYDQQGCFDSQLRLTLERKADHFEMDFVADTTAKHQITQTYKILMNKPSLVELCFYTKCTSEPFCFNAQIEIEDAALMEIKITSLLYYKLDLELDSVQLGFNFLCNFWDINFSHTGFDLSVDSINTTNYTLNEAFEVGGFWYKFVSLDIVKSTIQLIKLGQSERIKGTRKGYYVDKSKLADLCRKVAPEGNRLIQQIDDKNILLYFWGPWCVPCIKNIEAHSELSKRLENRDSVIVFNFPFLILEHDANDLYILKQTHDIAPIQFVQEYSTGYYPLDSTFDKPGNVLDLLRVSSFPEYILINREGRILYRGNNSKKDLQYFLRSKHYL